MSIILNLYFVIFLVSLNYFLFRCINTVVTILCLITLFILFSCYFFLLGVEFLAVLLIIVYVGGVSILFLYVIMMLNLRILEVYNFLTNYLPIGFGSVLIFFFEFFGLFNEKFFVSIFYFENFHFGVNFIYLESNLLLIGIVLLNEFFFLLGFIGFILLASMLSAISLTIRLIFKSMVFNYSPKILGPIRDCSHIKDILSSFYVEMKNYLFLC